MEFLPLAVAIVSGLAIPAIIKTFSNKRGERLTRLKALIELKKVASDLPENHVLARIVQAEINTEEMSRGSVHGLAKFLAAGVVGVVASFGLLFWQEHLIGKQDYKAFLLDPTISGTLAVMLMVGGPLFGLKFMGDRGPGPVQPVAAAAPTNPPALPGNQAQTPALPSQSQPQAPAVIQTSTQTSPQAPQSGSQP